MMSCGEVAESGDEMMIVTRCEEPALLMNEADEAEEKGAMLQAIEERRLLVKERIEARRNGMDEARTRYSVVSLSYCLLLLH